MTSRVYVPAANWLFIFLTLYANGVVSHFSFDYAAFVVRLLIFLCFCLIVPQKIAVKIAKIAQVFRKNCAKL